MQKNNIDYTLYLCTDRELMSTETIEESVELAIAGGCTVVQLREKDCSSLDFYETALRVKEITGRYGVPLIINDRVDIALAVDAEGVHVGQSDLPPSLIRKLIGEEKILGVSAHNIEEAVAACTDGADYLGVGAMFTTSTKADAQAVSMEELMGIRDAVDVPIVAIGGINKDNLERLKGTGVDGLAVVSAVVAQKDIAGAAEELVRLFKNTDVDN